MKKTNKLILISLLSYPIARLLAIGVYYICLGIELGLSLMFHEIIEITNYYDAAVVTICMAVSINVCVLIKAQEQLKKEE